MNTLDTPGRPSQLYSALLALIPRSEHEHGQYDSPTSGGSTFASLHDVKRSLLDIQQQQDSQNTLMDLTRVQAFVEGMEQLHHVLGLVAPDAEPLLGHVWGPMRLILKAASENRHAFESILAAYLDLGLAFPPIEDYARLFQGSLELRGTLADLFREIVRFHYVALKLFIRNSWFELFEAEWKDFDFQFRHGIIANMDLYRELLDSHGEIIRSTASSPVAATSLSLADSQMVVQGVRAYQSKLSRQLHAYEADEARRRQSQKEAVLAWIDPSDQNEEAHQSYCSIRTKHPGAGAWVLRDEKVAGWMMPPRNSQDHHLSTSMLWVVGERGSGKSVLASTIIEECRRLCEHTAYFYCSSAHPTRSTHLGILKGLLHQLMSSFGRLLPSYHARMASTGHPSLQDENQAHALMGTIAEFVPRAFIVVDGLDECAPSVARLTSSFLADLVRSVDEYSPGRLRILITAGNTSAAADPRSVMRIQSEDTTTDLRAFVVSRAGEVAGRWGLELGEQARVTDTVCRKAAGSFLFADMSIKYLDLFNRKSEFLGALMDGIFPETLNDVYRLTIDRLKASLDARPASLWGRAVDLFAWITLAKRPLEWHEISFITAFETSDFHLAAEPARFTRHARDLCGPLVRVVEGRRIELVHSSAKDVIQAHEQVNVQLMQLRLAIQCMRYLGLDCFCKDRLPDGDRTAYVREGYVAFQDYASACWAEHVKAVARSCADLFSRRPDLVSEFDAALEDFISAYRPGLQHEAALDFVKCGYVVALGPTMGTTADLCPAADMTSFPFFPKLKFLLSHMHTQGKRPDAQDRLLVPQLQTALRANRQVLERLFEAALASEPPSTAAAPASEHIPARASSPLPLPLPTYSSRPSSPQKIMLGSRPAPDFPPYPTPPLPSARLPPPSQLIPCRPASGCHSGPGSSHANGHSHGSLPTLHQDPSLGMLIQSYYGTRPWKCSHLTCRLFYAGFSSASRRNSHQALHEKPYQCTISGCMFGFTSTRDRDRHIRQHHPFESSQLPPFVQPSRRRRWGNGRGAAGALEATIITVPLEIGGHAETTVTQTSAMEIRERRHDEAAMLCGAEASRPRLFWCSLCSKNFTRKINLTGHVRSHYGQRPFQCQACGKSFARSNDCKRHEKIHARRGAAAAAAASGTEAMATGFEPTADIAHDVPMEY